MQINILKGNQENKIKLRIILVCKESIPERNWTTTHESKSSEGTYWTKTNVHFFSLQEIWDL